MASTYKSERKKHKICENCEARVRQKETACPNCGRRKFRPGFVKKRVYITKNFSVNVTSHLINKKQRIINLYKWFPGKTPWKVNINTRSEWEKIVFVVENELAPLVGWEIKSRLLNALEQTTKIPPTEKDEVGSIVQRYHKLMIGIIRALDFQKIDKQSHKQVLEILNSTGKVISKSDEALLIAFKNIIKSLPKQGKLALIQLEDLLKDWSLKQITGVTQIVKERLNELEIFELAVRKDETFEIKGKDSIHRILEGAMWIIDERYWLLNSNETLRKIVGDEIVKRNKGDERKRPDFVCGLADNKLIIIELKRPSHKLVVDDLNQLEGYLKIIETYSGENINFEAYLIGKKIDEDLKKTMKYRKTLFRIRTYTDLISDTERRYQQFLDVQK